jgi:hypothetical protein
VFGGRYKESGEKAVREGIMNKEQGMVNNEGRENAQRENVQ